VAVTDTSAARTRRYRLRLAGKADPAAPQPCPECGRLVRSTRTAPLCSQCWKRSPAGREANRQRMAATRAAQRQQAGDGLQS
jgi:endogenous inhibitor of DNA gyrase (YacG/DUF329 family)